MIEKLYQLFLQCNGVTTDSRNCPQDSLFIALKGETFNGNAFADKALEAGCKYVVIDEASYLPKGDARYILVDNCLETLHAWLTVTVVIWGRLSPPRHSMWAFLSLALLVPMAKPPLRNSPLPFFPRNTMYSIHRATSTIA